MTLVAVTRPGPPEPARRIAAAVATVALLLACATAGRVAVTAATDHASGGDHVVSVVGDDLAPATLPLLVALAVTLLSAPVLATGAARLRAASLPARRDRAPPPASASDLHV